MTNPQIGTRIPGTMGTPGAVAQDGVSLGAVAHARVVYFALPDIRIEKIREIQRRMAAGAFQPSAADLADAILDSAAKSLLCR